MWPGWRGRRWCVERLVVVAARFLSLTPALETKWKPWQSTRWEMLYQCRVVWKVLYHERVVWEVLYYERVVQMENHFIAFLFFFVVAAKQLQIWPHALTGVVYLLLFSQSVMSFVHWYFLFFQFFISKLISAVIIITTATNITISHHHNVLDGVNASWFCSWFLLFEVVLFPIYSKYKLMLFIII